ncbi:MAG: hypothetical protein OGM09_02980 [Fusobacterium varium]|uniref:hypothetical protein n=1 Tax=Fusobacterium varium TaxID=856 RepID=UPI00242C0866|nr:hypothetical protein [Fusobacterium varium]UYI79194.1 MAG: hypothetical protein OGM09_02980 [Fusobacterium varium]
MKKTFFMVGILAALSMTAFGAEAAKEATKEITLKGVSVKELKLTSVTTEIDFGKVMIGGSKTSNDIILSLDGEKGMSVSLSSDIAGITDVTFAASPKDIGTTEKIILTEGTGTKTIALVYSPTTDADLDATLKITATYDDIAE